MTKLGMNYNIISRETEWIRTATPVVIHSGIPFHPISNPIKAGTSLTQCTQHQCRTVGILNAWFINKDSPEQIAVVFEAEGENIAPETMELGIVALLQANPELDLQATRPMLSHFYNKTGTKREYGIGNYPNISSGLVINTELILQHPFGK
jgi:hypothetical protein